MSAPAAPTVKPGYYGYEDAKVYTGLSVSMLEKLVLEKRLVPRRVGRRVLFAIADLDAMLEATVAAD